MWYGLKSKFSTSIKFVISYSYPGIGYVIQGAELYPRLLAAVVSMYLS